MMRATLFLGLVAAAALPGASGSNTCSLANNGVCNEGSVGTLMIGTLQGWACPPNLNDPPNPDGSSTDETDCATTMPNFVNIGTYSERQCAVVNNRGGCPSACQTGDLAYTGTCGSLWDKSDDWCQDYCFAKSEDDCCEENGAFWVCVVIGGLVCLGIIGFAIYAQQNKKACFAPKQGVTPVTAPPPANAVPVATAVAVPVAAPPPKY